MATSKDSLDMIFSNANLTIKEDYEPVKSRSLTLWVPEEYKEKFDLLQLKTKRQFGKLLQEVVKKSMDKIDVEKI